MGKRKFTEAEIRAVIAAYVEWRDDGDLTTSAVDLAARFGMSKQQMYAHLRTYGVTRRADLPHSGMLESEATKAVVGQKDSASLAVLDLRRRVADLEAGLRSVEWDVHELKMSRRAAPPGAIAPPEPVSFPGLEFGQ